MDFSCSCFLNGNGVNVRVNVSVNVSVNVTVNVELLRITVMCYGWMQIGRD